MTSGTTRPFASDPDDSLFAQQCGSSLPQEGPWWQKSFLLHQPTLVTAWNGVFPTVFVNIFGIVIFLRLGWIVGTAGVGDAIIVLALCCLFSSVTVLSAIGICERCKIESGGIYFLISHVLGKRIGGAVGIIYTFGQCTATGLVALGFGESMTKLFGVLSQSATKAVAVGMLVILTALNFAGLRFIIRLQLLLFCFLGIAMTDFFLGSLTTIDREDGIEEITSQRLATNWDSHYDAVNCSLESGEFETQNENFFGVFAMLFANFIGVLAGVNISGNLANPRKDIAEGELSAIGASFVICLIFMLLLGASVDRTSLLCDYMLSERISWTKVCFLSGLYISCLASIISSTLGTSRVVNGIANEGLIPPLRPLLAEESSDKTPLKATIFVTLFAVLFVLLGDLNQLAVLSSMPFLVTYAFVNYAYCSLAMSTDLASMGRGQPGASGTHYGSNDGVSCSHNALDSLFVEGQGTLGPNELGTFGGQEWYSKCINRYVSFGTAIMHVLVVIFINKWVAFLHLVAFVLLYLYLGGTCQDQGVTQFSLVHMIRVAIMGEDQLGTASASGGAPLCQPSIVPPQGGLLSNVDYTTSHLNEASDDYSSRKPYHHSEHVGTIQ